MPNTNSKKDKKVRTMKGMTLGGPRINKDKQSNSASQKDCVSCHEFDLSNKGSSTRKFKF